MNMTIFTTEKPLEWGELDVPLIGLDRDWYGRELAVPAGYCLIEDGESLWCLAHHRAPAVVHPSARPGKFQAELWKYDVAELFIADPSTGRYLEVNFAPNGAWWTCEFVGVRQRKLAEDREFFGVETYGDMAEDGSWVAAIRLPLAGLRECVGYGVETRMNFTMILESPEQRFVTAAKLSEGEPDFHLPGQFPKVQKLPLP